MFEPEERRRWLKRIAAPTVILWGECDFALRIELAEENVHRLGCGRLIRFCRASHWLAEDLPAPITHHLLAHLRA
jgi:pimeloyl-ACP methyl ester carboxylesterase